MDRKISGEKLPVIEDNEDYLKIQLSGGTSIKGMSIEQITDKLEVLLLERAYSGSKIAFFQLAQLYFEQGEFGEAIKYFTKAAAKGDFQAKFQLGVIYYDGLGGNQNYKKGFELMMELATSTVMNAQHLVRVAQYNVGRAYLQGFGTKQSDDQAERFWLLAADDGNPNASVMAQSMLGMFYSKTDNLFLKKAFFWHSEATGNGSLESQGALGVMYLKGLGCKKNMDSAFICLRHASERGNVYAMGHLVAYYYRCKLFRKTVELASRVSEMKDIEQIAADTGCLECFIRKGIAMACFYYGRLLYHGHGVKKNTICALDYYSKCYSFDKDTCAILQRAVQYGEI